MVHRNAPLSETGRLRLAQCVVDDGWPLRRAAERFQVAVTTAAHWSSRSAPRGRPGWPIAAHGQIAAAHYQSPRHPPLGSGPDRVSAGFECFDSAQGPEPLRVRLDCGGSTARPDG